VIVVYNPFSDRHTQFKSQCLFVKKNKTHRNKEAAYDDLLQIVSDHLSIFLPKACYTCLYIQHLSVPTEVAKPCEMKETISAKPTPIAFFILISNHDRLCN
jgi:hypothetical protein